MIVFVVLWSFSSTATVWENMRLTIDRSAPKGWVRYGCACDGDDHWKIMMSVVAVGWALQHDTGSACVSFNGRSKV